MQAGWSPKGFTNAIGCFWLRLTTDPAGPSRAALELLSRCC
jgi:hypothetical protein